MKNIISCHMPKTAGASLRRTLQDIYSKHFIADYNDKPLQRDDLSRNGNCIEQFCQNFSLEIKMPFCIHGHFLPAKYLPLKLLYPDVYFITWLRDPVDRLMSHYNFWKRNACLKHTHPLWEKCINEDWTFETFGTCNELANIYSKFLFSFPIQQLDFIGISERYDTDLRQLCCMLDVENYDTYEINTGDREPCSSYYDHIEDAVIQKIKRIHGKDFDLYQYALNKRS